MSASVDSAAWSIASDGHAPALEISLLKQTVILAWSQFVYAEGGDDEIHIAFASHDVVIKGCGLEPLLPAITANQITCLRASPRSEHFPGPAVRFIREIEVRRIDAN